MSEKYADLAYVARQLCEYLRDRPDILDAEEDLTDLVDEMEGIVESLDAE